MTNELVSSRVAGEPQVALVTFPGVFRQLTLDRREVQLKPYVLAGQPLRYDPQFGEFTGSIRLGIADLFGGGEGRVLSAPLTFEVLEADLAEPQSVMLKTTSPPHQTIRIRTAHPTDPLIVRVASRFNREGVAISVPLSPTLFLRTERREIRGYGLETTKVYVSAVGRVAQGTLVQLHADPGARFEQSQLVLSEQGTAEAVLRSDASGSVKLMARATGFSPGTATLSFRAPWRTVAAAALGGMIGGALRMLMRSRTNTRWKHRYAALVLSMLGGTLVFLLYVLGVNLFGVSFLVHAGDVFVLAVSALAAWAGTAALRQFRAATA